MSTVARSSWTGWVVFAGVLLLISGIFSIVQGLVAVIGPNSYYVLTAGSLWLFDVAGWGWWNLIIGVLLALTGLAVIGGQTWARVVAIILLILSAIGQLLLIPAQPWWSLIVIAIDILVIYALIVHGRELREES
ncbi:membrane protein [Microbacterium aoyamense]|uniref:Membrane protein n=1 Tax=Microbacterium aoyamense TaxID=344166 RepID=A0ABN2PYR5_9MICO|nr:hypothetical protein [Microbacterium aoyamense]